MSPRQGRPGVPHRARTAAPPSASGSEAPASIIINAPSSFVQCVPAIITWLGGTPPYTLQASFNMMNDTELIMFEPETLASDIFATQFIWNPGLMYETRVLLYVTDAVGHRAIARNGMVVLQQAISHVPCIRPPNRLVRIPQSSETRTALVSSSSPVIGTTSAPTISTSTTHVSQTPVTTPSHVASKLGSSIGVAVAGVAVFLLLGTFIWWRSYRMIKKREGRNGEHLVFLSHLAVRLNPHCQPPKNKTRLMQNLTVCILHVDPHTSLQASI